MGRILVVDDHDSLRKGLVRALNNAGHDVEEAPNGTVADTAEFWTSGKTMYDPAQITLPTLIALGQTFATPGTRARACADPCGTTTASASIVIAYRQRTYAPGIARAIRAAT